MKNTRKLSPGKIVAGLLLLLAVLYAANLAVVNTGAGCGLAQRTAQTYLREELGVEAGLEELFPSESVSFTWAGLLQWRSEMEVIYLPQDDEDALRMFLPAYLPFWVTGVENFWES